MKGILDGGRPRRVRLAGGGAALVLAGMIGGSAGVPAGEQAPMSVADIVRTYVQPRGYVCARAASAVRIDGRLDEAAWREAAWTEDFVDIAGPAKPRPRLRTRAKMLWDERCLYIGAELEEPDVWGTVTRHDDVIFRDNDFEVFIDPGGEGGPYAELEVNALGTTWDLLLTRPYRDGGRAVNGWEMAGLRLAVYVDGTCNDARDRDRGWSVEMAIPWEALAELSGRKLPPREGEQMRINFSRVEWRHTVERVRYRKVSGMPEDNWVWSPQGVVDMHRPETWGYVQFAARASTAFRPDPAGVVRHVLSAVHERQQAFRKAHGHWARTLEELGVRAEASGAIGPVRMAATPSLFEAWAEATIAGQRQTWHISQDSRVWRE